MKEKIISASLFKVHCLKIMDQVRKKKEIVIITKRNVPVVKMVPLEEEEKAVFGAMSGAIKILSNIVDPIEEVWDACN